MKFPFILRSDQLAALHQLRTNDHLIYIAATGSGKSILFQKFIFDHPKTRAVLISPLNALSRQQSERFQFLGIKTFDQVFPSSDDYGVWILSPEKLNEKVLNQMNHWKPSFLIVDEAHCIWEWGERFRPAYRRILELIKLPFIQKTLWCSATLTKRSQNSLVNQLSSLKHNKINILGSFSLPNQLELRVEKISPEVRLNWLRNMLGLYADQSGMVFCNTRSAAVLLQKYLQNWGIKSFFYHAGLSIEEKLNLEKQLRLQKDSSIPVVVVATSAFGMGMDYSFFKFCILFEPPFSILSLVQAIGRVGRGSTQSVNQKSRAHILWHPVDFSKNRSWVNQQEVHQWCTSLQNPLIELENYFNGESLSGTMKKDEYPFYDSYRTTSLD